MSFTKSRLSAETRTKKACNGDCQNVHGKRRLLKLCAAGLLFISTACENAPPQIQTLQVQVTYVHEALTQSSYEELSVWITVDDPDGIDQLSEIHIIHDESQLYWRLIKGEWVQQKAGGRVRIGALRLTRADLSAFPLGRYRIVVYDVGQEKSERVFSLSQGVNEFHQYIPRLQVSGSSVMLDSPFLLNYTYTLSEEGEVQDVITISSGPVNLLLGSARPRYVLSRYQNRLFISGPYYIP